MQRCWLWSLLLSFFPTQSFPIFLVGALPCFRPLKVRVSPASAPRLLPLNTLLYICSSTPISSPSLFWWLPNFYPQSSLCSRPTCSTDYLTSLLRCFKATLNSTNPKTRVTIPSNQAPLMPMNGSSAYSGVKATHSIRSWQFPLLHPPYPIPHQILCICLHRNFSNLPTVPPFSTSTTPL